MRVALDALPGGVEAQVEGKRAIVSYGNSDAPTVVSVATDGANLILFPDRSYKQEDLAKALGLKS